MVGRRLRIWVVNDFIQADNIGMRELLHDGDFLRDVGVFMSNPFLNHLSNQERTSKVEKIELKHEQ
jgi:hypothetical protein